MRRMSYRPNGQQASYGIERKSGRHKINQAMHKYGRECDSIFQSRFIEVAELDRGYLNLISAILENREPLVSEERVRRRSRAAAQRMPTQTSRARTRIQRLPSVQPCCKINVRAVSKSIIHIDRSTLDRRERRRRPVKLETLSFSSKNTPDILMHESPLRLPPAPRVNTEPFGFTMRRGWNTEEDQRTPGLDDFMNL